MLVDLYQQGRLDLDAFVSEEIGIGDVEAAFEKMHHGDVLRERGDLRVTLRVDHGVTSGTFSLDGQTFDVDNNVWVVGDDESCVVIDAPHSVEGILAVVGERRVTAIVCTHAHDDHVRVARGPARGRDRADPAASGRAAVVGADASRPSVGRRPLRRSGDPGGRRVADGAPHPGPLSGLGLPPAHPTSAACSPATRCSRAVPAPPAAPTATATLIVGSIRARLLPLPDDTVVHTGHGDDTTIGDERDALG